MRKDLEHFEKQIMQYVAKCPEVANGRGYHSASVRSTKWYDEQIVPQLLRAFSPGVLAREIERRCAAMNKVVPVLVEVNSGRESQKTGVLPEQLDELVRRLSGLPHLRVQGLMTMGPRFGDPEDARPYFRLTREAFERLAAARIPDVELRYLSMGMSNSYLVAIEEGANMVRIGTMLFGERDQG